jgi:hypothetical protein
MVTKMKIEWRRGFFRAWVVLALAWVAVVGWNEYVRWVNHTEGECWDRLAKWPDGTPFGAYDMYNDTKDASSEKDQWRDAVFLKLRDCEAAMPILQRLARAVSVGNRSELKDALSLIVVPPVALLISGWLLGWIVTGFRTTG